MTSMTSCPHCSHKLLRHLRSQERYWYCPHCRLETSDLFITVRNSSLNCKWELVKSHSFSLVA